MASRISASQLPIGTTIAPQSVAAAGNAVSGWMDVGTAINILTEVNLGALGGGTVTLTFQQATDGAGSGAKALAWTGYASAVNNANSLIDNDPELLDINNGFRFVQAKLANVGGTGALLSAALHNANPRVIS